MIRRAFAGLLIWLASALSGHAADAPDYVREACRSDATQLCPMSTLIACGLLGSCNGVHRCFVAHRHEISRECMASLNRWRREGR